MSKTIIFDLGGVYFSNGTRAAIDAIAAEYTIARDAVDGILNGEPGREYRLGNITAAQFWQTAKTYCFYQCRTA